MNQEQIQLRDIHPPLLLPEDPNYLMLAAIILGVLAAIALVYWFFWLRKKSVVLPCIHETALAEMILARREMSSDQALLYATEVSDILRRFIEKRFQIPSTRQTTKEFFSRLTGNLGVTQITLSEKHCNSLSECLEQCDMAKFARRVPDMQNMEKMESAVKDFIEETREKRAGGK